MTAQTKSECAPAAPNGNQFREVVAEILKSLERGADQYEVLEQEIRELEQLRPALEAEIRAIAQAIGSEVPAEKLILAPTGDEQFPPAVKKQVDALQTAKLKLEVLPEAVRKRQARLGNFRQSLNQTYRNALAALRSECDSRLEALRAELTASMLKVCGGDEDRARIAVAAALEQSDLSQWLREILTPNLPTDIAGRARYVADLVERFGGNQGCP